MATVHVQTSLAVTCTKHFTSEFDTRGCCYVIAVELVGATSPWLKQQSALQKESTVETPWHTIVHLLQLLVLPSWQDIQGGQAIV